MLPFLKNKKDSGGIAGVLIRHRQPDEKPEQEQQDDPSAAIRACAQGLIDAVHKRDVQGVADHLYDAFEILESTPHEESQAEPHSYDSSKED